MKASPIPASAADAATGAHSPAAGFIVGASAKENEGAKPSGFSQLLQQWDGANSIELSPERAVAAEGPAGIERATFGAKAFAAKSEGVASSQVFADSTKRNSRADADGRPMLGTAAKKPDAARSRASQTAADQKRAGTAVSSTGAAMAVPAAAAIVLPNTIPAVDKTTACASHSAAQELLDALPATSSSSQATAYTFTDAATALQRPASAQRMPVAAAEAAPDATLTSPTLFGAAPTLSTPPSLSARPETNPTLSVARPHTIPAPAKGGSTAPAPGADVDGRPALNMAPQAAALDSLARFSATEPGSSARGSIFQGGADPSHAATDSIEASAPRDANSSRAREGGGRAVAARDENPRASNPGASDSGGRFASRAHASSAESGASQSTAPPRIAVQSTAAQSPATQSPATPGVSAGGAVVAQAHFPASAPQAAAPPHVQPSPAASAPLAAAHASDAIQPQVNSGQLHLGANSSELKISVQLPELGKVEVRAVSNHEVTTAHLTAFHHDALQALSAGRDVLEEALRSHNVVLGSLDSHARSFQGQGSQQQSSGGQRQPGSQSSDSSAGGAPSASPATISASAEAAITGSLPEYASISVRA